MTAIDIGHDNAAYDGPTFDVSLQMKTDNQLIPITQL